MKKRLKKVITVVVFLSILLSVYSCSSFKAFAAETDEFHAVWITYLEFSDKGYTKKAFMEHIDKMFDKVSDMGMNAVVVQIRPFSDAFYPSKYFPWSKYVSGEQGKNPGYDPLAYMIEAAHKRGLSFHAWLNPYRVTSSGTDVNVLAKNHPARNFLTDKNKANDRYVLSFGGRLYYNPAYAKVRNLIVNGVKEIVENYDVDGIHFDDYFYPTLGSKYKTIFDAPEYEAYKKAQIAAKEDYRDIVSWRKWQVNSLVYRIYEVVKAKDKNIQFGISPEGHLESLLKDDRHYTDLTTWFTKKGYIDYICPQIYFSFEHNVCPFEGTLKKWIDYMGNSKVKLYVGIPVYKAGSKIEEQFYKDKDVLKKMLEVSRDTDAVSGFVYYRYEHLLSSTCKKAVSSMLKVIQ